MEKEACVIGIDVGEINTDSAIVQGNKVIAISKEATTDDVTTGIVNSLHSVLHKCPLKEICLQNINIGTIHFTKAIVERNASLSKVVVLRLARPPCTEAMPPFYEFPDQLRKLVDGGWHHLNGGYEYDGRELGSINEEEICKAVAESRSKGHSHFVLCGIFSILKREQECQAKEIILKHFPNASVTCSHEFGYMSFLDRENLAIMNESLKDLAREVLGKLQEAIDNLGLTCPIHLCQNDGTLCSTERAIKFPVHTFGCGTANSVRGAGFLAGVKNAVVVDIGLANSTIGILHDGFPEETNKKLNIGGVSVLLPVPMAYKIRSEVDSHNGTVLASFERHESIDHVSNGGNALTEIPDKNLPKLEALTAPEKKLKTILHDIQVGPSWVSSINMGVDYQTDNLGVPNVFVGTCSMLINNYTDDEIIPIKHAQAANAIGAALCQVSGKEDIMYLVDPDQQDSGQANLEDAKQRAVSAAIMNGAITESVQIANVHVSHISQTSIQYKIKAFGDLATDVSRSVFVDLDRFRLKAPLPKFDIGPENVASTSLDSNDLPEWYQLVEEKRGENAPFDDNGEWILNKYDIGCIAIGSGILGCGGGGCPQTGIVEMLHLLEQGKKSRILTVNRLLSESDPINSMTIAVSMMGSLICCNERLQTNRAVMAGVATGVDIHMNPMAYKNLPMEQFDGGVTYTDNIPVPNTVLESILENGSKFKPAISVMPCEAGGANVMEALAVSASLGIPCVDADGMGRAFPELQMTSYCIYGLWSPFIQVGDPDRITISWTANTPKDAENFHRHICIQNGCKASILFPGLKPCMIRSMCVEGSISQAWKLGNAVLEARRKKTSPVEAVVKNQCGKLLFTAKIVDLKRQTDGGFEHGLIIFQDLINSQNQFTIIFQNENVVVKHNHKILATVPDLICLLDLEYGEAVPTEEVRCGLKVAVIVLPASHMLKTEQALPLCGPKGFGLDIEYENIWD